MIVEFGRMCVKIAGRDAGKRCIVVDVIDKNFVMIDGETRRKRCNIAHLEPLSDKVDIKKGSSHDEVKEALMKIGIELKDKKPKDKTASEQHAEKQTESNKEESKKPKKLESKY